MLRPFAIAVTLVLTLQAEPARALDDQTAGDIVTGVIALGGLGLTYAKDDPEGREQLAWNVGTELVVNTLLRGAFNETEYGTRPNGHAYGFPSGHTGFVWSFAAFARERYGWRYGAPAYLASLYVAHTRITTDHHYWRDIVAAAVVSEAIAWATVTRYEDVGVRPLIGPDLFGLSYAKRWG